MSNSKICGRDYEVVPPIICHERDRHGAISRVHVDGVTKSDGTPIRFKSQERARNHVRNMRLEKE